MTEGICNDGKNVNIINLSYKEFIIKVKVDNWINFTFISIFKLLSKSPFSKNFLLFCFSIFPERVVILVLGDILPLFFIISYVPPIIPELCILSEGGKQRAGLPKNKV